MAEKNKIINFLQITKEILKKYVGRKEKRNRTKLCFCSSFKVENQKPG